MKNKGFTLVELLAVIVIIGLVALVAVPAVNRNITESRIELEKIQVQTIELAGKKWASENYNELDLEYLNTTSVTIKMLQDLDYLTKDKIKHPNPVSDDKKYFDDNSCVIILYNFDTKQYEYNYESDTSKCKDGYYYKKENDEWVKKIDYGKKKVSIATTLIGENKENIVASGDGLYEEEDKYVYRGNVTNNNIIIKDKMFRIISIDKNTKSLKVISNSGNNNIAWGSLAFNSRDNNVMNKLIELASGESFDDSYINKNVKWNIGSISSTDYSIENVISSEKASQINMNVGIISLGEYMDASLDTDCRNGDLTKCSKKNYLSTDITDVGITDAWTLTTNNSSVAVISNGNGITWESDLINELHYVYNTMNIKNAEYKTKEINGKIYIEYN